ncbi:MAG: ATP-binding protein [Firmicutes bacterium]|nr:ATP-binding protein [Bacillota bacterium]
MSTARHLLAILESHVEGDSPNLYSTALQAAAREAELGHTKVAAKLRDLVERGRSRESAAASTIPLAQPRGELANLVAVSYPHVGASSMVLPAERRSRLERILLEQSQHHKLRSFNLAPRRKLLLVGPPGSGKTMTASVIAGELRLPLFTILLEGVITKFMGETAQKLRTIFDSMTRARGVYFFDEFDAIGARRSAGNDVGEIRRVLNSFLSLLENDQSESLIIAATNHPNLLDAALFRRFDDVLEYVHPQRGEIQRLMRSQLIGFKAELPWEPLIECANGLSYADIVRASQEAAKSAVLQDRDTVSEDDLRIALSERRSSTTPEQGLGREAPK